MSAAVHAVCCLLRTWNPLLPASDTVTSLAASWWPTVLIIIYCSSLIGVVVSESRCMRAFSRRGGPSLEGHPQGPVTGVGQGERPQMPAATVTVCSVSALPLPPASGTLYLSAYPLPTTVPVFCCCRQRLILQAWGFFLIIRVSARRCQRPLLQCALSRLFLYRLPQVEPPWPSG